MRAFVQLSTSPTGCPSIELRSRIQGLVFAGTFIPHSGPGPQAVPQQTCSFRDHIRNHEAAFIDGASLTHEFLIGRIANELGTPHEADGISKELAKMSAFLLGDVQPYFSVLDSNAELALEVGERVVQTAVAAGYNRRRSSVANAKLVSVHQVPFSVPLDVPQILGDMREGTIGFAVQTDGIPEAGLLDNMRRFPPLTNGPVTIYVEIARRRKLRLSSVGLPLSSFGFEVPLPSPLADTIGVVIAWQGRNVFAYVAGQQVAGVQREGAVQQPEP